MFDAATFSIFPLAPIDDLVERVATRNPASAAPNEVFTYIDLSAVDQQQKIIIGAREIQGVDAPSRARQVVQTGDILVSTVRPNLNGVAQVSDEYDGQIASTGFCVLRPKPERLTSAFLFHWVRSCAFTESMIRQATGASYPAVSDGIVRRSVMPCPAIAEQRRIAAILDHADELRAKRRVALASLDGLVQAIFMETFGDPVTNQKEWPRVTLNEILERIESGWSPTCLDRPAAFGEWGVLKLGAVTKCVFDPTESKALPSGLDPRPEIEVRVGDLLFTRKNTYNLVAACAIVEHCPPNLMLSDLLFRLKIRPCAPFIVGFLQSLLTWPSQRRAVQGLAGGSAGSMPNISKARLGDLKIIAPPLQLQKRFAERLQLINDIRNGGVRGRETTDHLFASLQHRAFRGEL